MIGRPTAYSEDMLKKAEEYINGGYKEREQLIPTTAGLASYINVAKSTIYKWCEDKNHPFSDYLALCNEIQELKLLNGGLSGEYNAAITKLILGRHGYSEKQETDITSGGKPMNEWHFHPVTNNKDGQD